MYMTSAEGCI